ncbi:MAG: VIT domain-containing protein [Cyanobacteria bacterium J06642_11]
MVQTALPKTVGLYVQDADIAFPLKHTDVKARVSGNLSRVDVTHTFENPFTTALEATYVFPLPDEAAVDRMVIRLGDRTIEGRVEKREQAQAIYEQAKQRGQTAGLLEQERANIFTQSLANILPGEQIEVVISYSDRLAYKQGSYEFVFPMVVGPRYIPGNPIDPVAQGTAPAPMNLNQDTDLVPDASRLNGPILPAGMRSGHDIQVTVEIETGSDSFQLAHIHSPSHQVIIEAQDGSTRITLAPGDTLPNKDLILRYQVAGEDTRTSLLTHSDKRGGHFALYLIPALSYDTEAYIAKDMVFLIDTSGSQSGAPLAQCQALMRRFIAGLHPQDTFNIVNFANTTQQLSQVPLANTPKNQQRALNYVNQLRAGGGTEMSRGLKTVLNLPQLNTERIRNIVLLTDGYIGNETQIFAEVQRSLGSSTRIHSFGAGSSVNRFLLNRVAEFGRGISHVVRHDQPVDQVVDTFFGQINNPVLGNLSLHWDGPGTAPSVYPMTPPDLFAEHPLIVFGRKDDTQSGTLRITGVAANGIQFEQSFSISFAPSGNTAIAQLWGRARIKDLMNQMVSGETTQGVEAVTETAIAYQLLSQYTAFVAVDDAVRVESLPANVAVPVMMPEAISHEGVFGAIGAPSRIQRTMLKKASSPQKPSVVRNRIVPRSAAPSDEFDVTLISPSMIDEEETAVPVPAKLSKPIARKGKPIQGKTSKGPVDASSLQPQVVVIKTEGLNDELYRQLQRHLQNLKLTEPDAGKLLFNLVIQQGRVKRVMLDVEASDSQNPAVVDQIRRALLTWRPTLATATNPFQTIANQVRRTLTKQNPQVAALPLRVELRIHA